MFKIFLKVFKFIHELFPAVFAAFLDYEDLEEIALFSNTGKKFKYIKSTYSFKKEEFLEQELTMDECREIVSDYEIKDEEVLKKVKHLYLRQDTTECWGGR